MKNLVHAWHLRPAHERRTLSIVGAVVVLVLIVAFAWLPIERSRARMAAELPRLRASIDALERDANEVRRLRVLPAAGVNRARAPHPSPRSPPTAAAYPARRSRCWTSAVRAWPEMT